MRPLVAFVFLLSILPSLDAQDAAPVKLPPQILTNQGVVELSDAGYDEDFLIDLIQARQTRFDVSADGLSFLAQHGLCEHVVRVMVARANSHDQHSVAVPVAGPVAAPFPTAVQGGVKMVPLAGTAWLHGASFPLPQTGPAATYQIVRRRTGLFHHRWYLIQSEPVAVRNAGEHRSPDF